MSSLCSKIILGSVFSLLLVGCSVTKKDQAFTNLYKGYPCNNHCGDFQAGYDAAQSNQFITDTRCDELNQTHRNGCLSYVQDYRVEHEQPGGYSFPVRSNVSN